MPRFSIKKLTNLRTKIKLTVLFKNKATSLETYKYTKRIEIHQSQTTGFRFPGGSLKCKGKKAKKASLLQIVIVILIYVAEKQNPKTFLASQVGFYPINSCKSIVN